MNTYSRTTTSSSRKRYRPDDRNRNAKFASTAKLLLLCAVLTKSSSIFVNAFSSVSTSSHSHSTASLPILVSSTQMKANKSRSIVSDDSLVSSNLMTDDIIAQQTRGIHQSYAYYDVEADDEEEDEDDYDEYVESRYGRDPLRRSHDFTDSVSSFLNLQQSMGSDILQAELQKQIDEGANVFIDKHVEADATEIEKIAMVSITEQLPKPAVRALTNTAATLNKVAIDDKKLKQKKDIQTRNDLTFVSGNGRVTPEEEVRLARIIQVGSALNEVKKNTEIKIGRELTKNEWADVAGIASTRELRRLIADYRNAKHDLVKANLGLVHAVVKQQWSSKYRTKSGITYDELVQEGSLGLIRAAELFDPSKGLRFSTYAVVWIKGILQNNSLSELMKLPLREKNKYSKIVKASRDMQMLNGEFGNAQPKQPSIEELASATGLSVGEVVETQRKMVLAKNILSLDYQYNTQSRSGTESSTSGSSDASVLFSDKNLQDQLEHELNERTQFHADLIATMTNNLTSREARLMRLRYGLYDNGTMKTLTECAEAMGISYTRVNQLEKLCLEKLRQAKDIEALAEYLLTIA